MVDSYRILDSYCAIAQASEAKLRHLSREELLAVHSALQSVKDEVEDLLLNALTKTDQDIDRLPHLRD